MPYKALGLGHWFLYLAPLSAPHKSINHLSPSATPAPTLLFEHCLGALHIFLVSA